VSSFEAVQGGLLIYLLTSVKSMSPNESCCDHGVWLGFLHELGLLLPSSWLSTGFLCADPVPFLL
jgi:hypothetical protein